MINTIAKIIALLLVCIATSVTAGTGRFGGGIHMCSDLPAGAKHCLPDGGVTLSKEITDGSTSVPDGKTFNKAITATFGGAEQCCDASSYANPTTTVKWSQWPAAAAAIANDEPVVVPCGTHVTLDQSPIAPLKGLRIEGSLSVTDDHAADIAVETGYVYNCGSLVAHLETTRLTITLVGYETIPGKAGFSTKAFVTHGGDIDLRGSMCNQTTWTVLAATADAGAQELRLEEPVGWVVGTEVMVASTDFQGTQTEVVTVTRVADGGRTLGLKAGLAYPHAGVAPITAEVAALSRNIKITSEASCAAIPNAEADDKPMCGHFVIDHTPRGTVCGVEVTNMGKHTTTGKYPMHMHMCGDAPAIQIRSNAVHSNHHRALVIHGTSYATWADNVVFRSVGHLLLTEDGGEQGNRIVRNVLALPKKPSPSWPKQCAGVVPSPYGGCEIKRCSHGTGIYEAVCGNRHDGETAAMWISNPANYIAHNRIIAGHNVGVRFETRGITGRVALLPDAVQHDLFRVGANRKSQGRAEGLGGFVGNVIHSSRHGIFNYPSWNPAEGILIDNYVAWKNGNAVFAKTKYAYNNPNLVLDEGAAPPDTTESLKMYNLRNATLLMNKIGVYTIHDDSKLHVSDSVLAPQIPAHLFPEAARDPIATAGACASEAARTMCSSEAFCTAGGDGTFDDGSGDGDNNNNDGDGQTTSGSVSDAATVQEGVTDATTCRKLPNGKWHKGVPNQFTDFEWRDAVDGADGTVAKPFGDWYYAREGKKFARFHGKSSLALSRRPTCGEAVFASTMKDGVVDTGYEYRTNPTKCVGAMGASPSTARRVSSAGAASNTHQFNVYTAFREGKHTVTGLPWSISADEATLAGARRNGFATWEEVGNGAGRRTKTGHNDETGEFFKLPGKLPAPLSCPSTGGQGCYLQAAGMQAHLGSHNKGYVHYGARKRHRHPIVFPTAAAVAAQQRAGRNDACPTETHEWQLVFRQTAPFKFDAADDWAQARRHNADRPDADNYSVLDDLESFRGRGDDDDETMAFTLKLEYPNDPYAFAFKKNGEAFAKAKYQENLRVWRQTNNPTVVATCVNDGGRARGEGRKQKTEVTGLCGAEDFENLFPTEWVPLAGKWGGLEYNGNGRTFISGSSYRRFGASSVGTGAAHWSIGSQQRDGPMAGDDHGVEVVELHACRSQQQEQHQHQQHAEHGEAESPAAGDDTGNGTSGTDEEAAEGGSWQLVFRQTAPFTFSQKDEWANAKYLNAHDPTWPNFSRLDDLEDFRSPDGSFRLKLRYPTAGKENVWAQENNPAAKATCKNRRGKPQTGNCGVDGFVAISTEVADGELWGGLEYNGDQAFIDGAVKTKGNNVWYSLGARRHVKTKLRGGVKRFPTFPGDTEETVVELYAFSEK